MKVKKSSSNTPYNFVSLFPIQLCMIDGIYKFMYVYNSNK